MAGKHTAGPWAVVEHSWSDIGVYASEHRVCLLSIYDEATEETQSELEARDSANARLIAAAPDLLEACQRALEQTDPVARSGDYAMLKAAIHRATQPLPPPNEE